MFLLTGWDSVDILGDGVVKPSLKFDQESVPRFGSIVDVGSKLGDSDGFVDRG